MSEKFSASATRFSAEFFPPKTPEGAEKLRATRKILAALQPEYFSVTFGAGSTQAGTRDTVLEMHKEGHVAAPHLSCIGRSRTDLRCWTRSRRALRQRRMPVV